VTITPHELRCTLLHLARDILESQSRSKVNAMRTAALPSGTDIITTEQIIAEATKLNDFVSRVPAKQPGE
jgi:hypothetical protein